MKLESTAFYSFPPLMLALLLSFMPSICAASSDYGMKIAAADFSIKVTYAAYDSSIEFGYIDDPSELLFDLISIIQREYGRLSVTEDKYWLDISIQPAVINISKYSYDSEVFELLYDLKPNRISKNLILHELCEILNINDCKKTLAETKCTYIYESKITLNDNFKNIILYGAFPSDEIIKRYVLKPSSEESMEFIKKRLSKENISDYFGVIE